MSVFKYHQNKGFISSKEKALWFLRIRIHPLIHLWHFTTAKKLRMNADLIVPKRSISGKISGLDSGSNGDVFGSRSGHSSSEAFLIPLTPQREAVRRRKPRL